MTVSKGSTPLSSSCGEVAELTWLSGLNWVPGRGFVTRYLGHRLEFLGLKSTRETVRHVIGRRTPHDDVVKAATVTAAAVRVFFLNKIRVSFKNMENDCTFFVKIYVFDRCWLHKAIYRLYKHFHLHIDCVCVCACVCVCEGNHSAISPVLGYSGLQLQWLWLVRHRNHAGYHPHVCRPQPRPELSDEVHGKSCPEMLLKYISLTILLFLLYLANNVVLGVINIWPVNL